MKTIALVELQEHGEDILREVEGGERFTILLAGRPVAQIGPFKPETWVPRARFLEAFRGLPADSSFFDDIRAMGDGADPVRDPWER